MSPADRGPANGGDDADASGDDDARDGEAAADAPVAPPSARTAIRTDDRRRDLAMALGAMVALACAVALAFHPSRAFSSIAFIALATTLVVLAVLTVARVRARGEMEMLRPHGGDLTLAAVVAGMLYALALGAQPLAFPRGSAAEASFLGAYLPLVDPLQPDARHATAVACAALCALEELVLRALVQPAIERATGIFRGWLATAALDAAAWIPAALLLADARVGFNPVYVGFAAVAAVATGWLRVRTHRAVPSMLARALAAWALIEFPIWAP